MERTLILLLTLGQLVGALQSRRQSEAGGSHASRFVTGTIDSTFESSEPNPSDLRSLVGRKVTLRGKFSLRGKIGPFLIVNGSPVYLVPRGSFSWGQRYSRMEGSIVSVTGTLRFFQAPPEPEPPDPTTARVPDYFYFDPEKARVRLANRK